MHNSFKNDLFFHGIAGVFTPWASFVIKYHKFYSSSQRRRGLRDRKYPGLGGKPSILIKILMKSNIPLRLKRYDRMVTKEGDPFRIRKR